LLDTTGYTARRIILPAAIIFFMTACAGLNKGPPPSTDIDELRFRTDVRTLASDEFEGRKPGNGESYLQPVPLVEISAVDSTLSIRGRDSVKSLTAGKDMVIWSKRPVPEAALRQNGLVFVGYGIVAPEYGWNDYAQVDVRGKTVVILLNDPGFGTKDPKVFRGNSETYYGTEAYKVEEATRRGAAGILLVHDVRAAGIGWNVVVNGAGAAQLDSEATAADDTQPMIVGWLSAAAAHALLAQAGVDADSVTAAAAHPGFKAVPLGLAMDAVVHNTVRRFTSSNVIAVLPGAKRRREYVLFTAHWDHLGRQPAAAGGAVYHGAVEDAAGTAALLTLAQSFVRTQPTADRSLVFIAFTASESGFLGSAYYAANPVFPLRDTAAVLNLDSMHIGGPTRDLMIFGSGNSELEDYVREAAQQQGREVRPDAEPELGTFFRSDQITFAQSGVPALIFGAGLDDSARGPAWGQAQRADYRMKRYYEPGDQYSADWDVRGTLDDLRLYYEVGNRLTHSRRFPRWYPNSEFRAAKSAARQSPGQGPRS
jgi:Zn-dependent M28 family amino/carboxypeptidase